MNSSNKIDKSNPSKDQELIKEIWGEDHKLQLIAPSPYSFKDQMIWFFRHLFGISPKRNEFSSSFIARKSTLNPVDSKFKIGFVGDIMKMLRCELDFSDDVHEFFSDVDLVVGNLEGIFTSRPKYVTSQKLSVDIMNHLKTLKDPEQWLLCVSNNHSGDYGFGEFIVHVNRLKWAGFNVFGHKNGVNFLYKDKINIVSGTKWLNQKRASYISRLKDTNDHFINSPGVFNILYPHWGYEYETFPRHKQVKEAQSLIKKWDMIVGHHSHVAQPINRIRIVDINKVICYSLGNLCSGVDRRGHGQGIVLKCEIGPLKSDGDILAIGNLEWQFIEASSEKMSKVRKEKIVSIVQKNKYFK